LHACRSTLEDPPAARIDDAQVVAERDDFAAVAAIVTLGISHPTAAGVSAAAQSTRPGTINTIVLVDGHLSPAAHANALMTATEAKSLVMAECSVRTPEGHLASGTGTDALVVACTGRGLCFEYAGPVSRIGALIGRAVRAATLNAVFVWHARRQAGASSGYRARIRNHGHSCFLCEIVIRSQFHTTYEPEA
jgi:Uncharacterized conserved protein